MDLSRVPFDQLDARVEDLVAHRESVCPLLGSGQHGEVRQSDGGALEPFLIRRITQRTSGRVQFRVRLDAGRVIIEGSSPTHYLKQLALVAVQEVLPSAPVDLKIRVTKVGSLSGPIPAPAVLLH